MPNGTETPPIIARRYYPTLSSVITKDDIPEVLGFLKEGEVYLENQSVEQADRYFNLLMNEIDYLTEYPKSGKDYNEIRNGYYRAKVKSHFIFYEINLKNNEVEVIRILHQQMDIESRLKE